MSQTIAISDSSHEKNVNFPMQDVKYSSNDVFGSTVSHFNYDCEVSSTSSTSSNTANTAGSTSNITANTAGTASSINNLYLSATDRKFILTTTTTATTVRISTSVIVKVRERGRSTL